MYETYRQLLTDADRFEAASITSFERVKKQSPDPEPAKTQTRETIQTQAKRDAWVDARVNDLFQPLLRGIKEGMADYVHKHIEAMADAIIRDMMAENKKLQDQITALSLRIDIESLKQQKNDLAEDNVTSLRSRNVG